LPGIKCCNRGRHKKRSENKSSNDSAEVMELRMFHG